MVKNYIFFFLLISTFLFSQKLDFQLLEINYRNGLNASHLFHYKDKILFCGSETESESEDLWAYDFATQQSSFIRDVVPESVYPFYSITPHFTLFKDKVYFIADNFSLQNKELWVTDGTADGTQKVYTFPMEANFISGITANDNFLLISSQNYLFVSDGTTEGTRVLKNAANEVFADFFVFNNYFVFAAKNINYANELWITNGNNQTFQVLDQEDNQPLYIHTELNCYNLNNVLFFYARTNTGSKAGLWSFDFATQKAKFIFSTINVAGCQILNNKLVFKGGTQQDGFGHLYATDGTSENTIKLTADKDIVSTFADRNYLVKLGNAIYFFPQIGERNKLWKTDGTKQGTKPTSIIIPDYASPDIIKFFPKNERIVIENASHNQFWLMDANETITPLDQNKLDDVIELEDKFILPYYTEKNGVELCQYDLASNSISLFNDGNHKIGSNPQNFVSTNDGKLIFTADDYEHGNEFYKINNSGEFPEMIKDFQSMGDSSLYGIYKGDLFQVGDFYYTKPTSYTNVIFRTNGNTEKTNYIGFSDNETVDQFSSFGNLNNQSLILTNYYYGLNDQVVRVWKIDNESSEKKLLKEIPTLNLPNITKTLTYNGEVYFTVQDKEYRTEIWKTDGTPENTKIAFDTKAEDKMLPKLLTVFDGKLLFSKNQKLFTYNKATNVVTEIQLENVSWFNAVNISDDPKEIDGKLYAVSQLGYGSIYKFDNMEDFPKKLMSDNFMGDFSNFQKCGKNIFLAAGNKNAYQALWSIDAEDNITSIIPNNSSNEIKDLTCVNNYIYFHRENSAKIWRSNGLDNETISLPINVTNGEQITENQIEKLISFQNKLYIVGNTESSGSELYYAQTELPIYLSTTETKVDSQKTKLILYPNPASDFIKIKEKTIQPNSFAIYDLSGKIISTGKYFGENQSIDITLLNKGVYILEIKTQNGTSFSEKFIKK